MTTATLNREDVRAIEWDCQQVLARFLQALDSRDGRTAAAQFAENGKWERSRGAGSFEGRAQIADNIANRAKNEASRHCMSNFVLDVKDADHAESRCYLTVFRNDAAGPEPVTFPIKMQLPAGVLLYCDKWVRTPEGWRIAEQWSERIFTR
jgi:hypothetical protein